MKRFPRPARRVRPDAAYEVTPAGEQAVLPDTPIEFEITPRGQGEYLPTQGKFRKGDDERRHKFTELECSISGHSAMLNLIFHYADAYAETDEQWEQLAGSRLDTILNLRAMMHGANLYA